MPLLPLCFTEHYDDEHSVFSTELKSICDGERLYSKNFKRNVSSPPHPQTKLGMFVLSSYQSSRAKKKVVGTALKKSIQFSSFTQKSLNV